MDNIQVHKVKTARSKKQKMMNIHMHLEAWTISRRQSEKLVIVVFSGEEAVNLGLKG